jgi:thioredoxin reductase (NADPH)
LILSEFAEKVTVIHRRDEFAARGEFLEQARGCSNVQFVTNSSVTAINGDNRLTSIDLADTKTRRKYNLPVDALLVRIGVEPNTKLVEGKLALDRRGYILIDAACRTNLPGIYAIGDAACPTSPTIPTATGTGATAAKAVLKWIGPGK